MSFPWRTQRGLRGLRSPSVAGSLWLLWAPLMALPGPRFCLSTFEAAKPKGANRTPTSSGPDLRRPGTSQSPTCLEDG